MEKKSVSVFSRPLPEDADALHFNIDACCQAIGYPQPPESAEAWKIRAEAIRLSLLRGLGLDPMPPRTPLNAVCTGKTERPTHTIENIVFESKPCFFVTANVYVPKGVDSPLPAVIVVPGHAMEDGKNYELYQLGELALVRAGFLVLSYDPIGQGERRLPGFSHELGYGSLLVGQTNEGMICWDTLRAFDYLRTREDVDSKRLGLAGNSGGGENTFYAMPLDDRIQVGASFSFVCSYEKWIRHGGNHCICNHLPGVPAAMEEFEIIGLNAPRPFLFGNGTQDKIFPIEGGRETADKAKRIYELLGYPDRVKMVEADGPHGWSAPLREACVSWMTEWLRDGEAVDLSGKELQAEDPKSEALLCWDGKGMPEGYETIVTLNRKRARSWVESYDALPENKGFWDARAEDWRRKLWKVLGGQQEAYSPSARGVRTVSHGEILVEVLSLETEPGMSVACLFLEQADAAEKGCPVVYLDGENKRGVLEDPCVRSFLKKGCPVLALDPRGVGEANVHLNHVTSDSVCLGRPLFGQMVWDVLQAVSYLEDRTGQGAISLLGKGAWGLLGLHAAALDDRIERVILEKPLLRYEYALENDPCQPIWIFVPNLLQVADVPHIASLVLPREVTLARPVGFGNASLDRDQIQKDARFLTGVAELLGCSESVRILPTDEDPSVEELVR